MHNIIHDTNKHHRHAYTYKLSRNITLIFYYWHNSTNHMQAFHEPPSLRPHCSSLSAVGHPRARTKIHRQGIPRLGKVNRKVTQFKRKDYLPRETYTHCSHNLIPRIHVPPQEYTPSLSHSPSAAPPPFWGFNNRLDRNT